MSISQNLPGLMLCAEMTEATSKISEMPFTVREIAMLRTAVYIGRVVKMGLMTIIIASAEISDDEFLTAFTNCTLPAASFRHGDHLRLAWLLLHRNPFDQALNLVRDGIQRYAAHLGAPRLYHETITTAWVTLLATHDEASFDEFIARNEHRLNLGLLHRFWTPEVLKSEDARSGWAPPDRAALPIGRRNRLPHH
jgi:hypothetical protein